MIAPKPQAQPISKGKSKTQRTRKTNGMTIAAGFVCDDGIVMCADSQESIGDYKVPVKKLITEQDDLVQVAMAGAGSGPLIDMAIGRITRALTGNAWTKYEEVDDQIAEVLSGLYDKEFRLFPVESYEDAVIDLLIGVKLSNQEIPVLFKTCATAVSRVEEYAVIGSGRAVEYQIYKLFSPNQHTNRVIPIAVNILTVAGVVLRSVGGTGRIVTLHKGNIVGIGEAWGWQIETARRASEELDAAGSQLLLDLLDTSLSQDDFVKRLVGFGDTAISLRVNRMQHHENEQQRWDAMLKAFNEGFSDSTKPSTPEKSEDQQ